MKKTYSKSFRQGLPGGPNEMFEKVKGIIVSERGQWDFPGMNTLVPTDDGRITMRGVPYPVYGQDETGYGQMMYPGQEYQFPGNNVLELPMAQVGLQVPVQKPDALRVQMNINPNAEYMEKKKSDVLDLDNTLDYLVETRGGTRDLWGRMADTIGYHESAHTMDPLQMQNSGGPGRGIFQFEAPSLVTAQNRYKRIASKLNLKTDPEILNAKSALELSPEQQYSLFLINLSESQAKLKDYADNKLPLVDLWLQGHKNKEAEGDRGSFRTSVQKAKDKSIQKGYDSFKQLGGSLPRFQNGNQVPAQSEPEPEPFTLPKGKGYYFKEDGETNLPKKMESIEKRNLRFYDFETEEDYVNFLTSEKSKNKDFGCKEDNCAEFANNRAGELVGLSGADLSTWLRGGKYKIGVGGNAWQTYGNILDLGGKSIFNNYKNQGDVSQVKPGDIIGLKKWSVYNHSGRYSIRGENAPKAGVDNSHQGVVEYVDKKGNIYIRHNIHGSTSVKKLTAKNNEYYLGDTGWKIVTAARPNFEKYQHADIDYKPEIGQYYVKPFISDYNPNEEIIFKQDVVKQADPHRYKTRHGNFMAGEAAQKKDWLTGQLNIQGIPVTERAGNEDMQKFVNSLNDNKEKLMHYYHLKNDEFNEIAKHALATAGAESDFGTSSKLKIKESSPALARLIKNARDLEIYDSDEMSRGIGQVKPYSLDDIFKQMFGVTERNINKPEYNALAVFSHLADDIRKVKNWSKKNTDLPEEVRNNYPFLATAAYVNPYTVAAGNLSYDPSFQNDPNKPYEPIGLDNKRLRIISDYIKDVGILNTKNPFAGQKLKEFRVVPEQQLGGALPRAQMLGEFNPQSFQPNPITGLYNWEKPRVKPKLSDFEPKQKAAPRSSTSVATKSDPVKAARQINAAAAEEYERNRQGVIRATDRSVSVFRPGAGDPEAVMEYIGVPGAVRFVKSPVQSLKGAGNTIVDLGLTVSPFANMNPAAGFQYAKQGTNPLTGEESFRPQDVEGAFNTLDAAGLATIVGAGLKAPLQQGLKQTGNIAKIGLREGVDLFHPVGRNLKRIEQEGISKGLSAQAIKNRQMQEVGITSLQRKGYFPGVSEILSEYFVPYAYDNPTKRLLDIPKKIIKGDRNTKRLADLTKVILDEGKNTLSKPRYDAWRMYSGLPQKHGTFRIAETHPINHPSYTKNQLNNLEKFSLNDERKLLHQLPNEYDTFRFMYNDEDLIEAVPHLKEALKNINKLEKTGIDFPQSDFTTTNIMGGYNRRFFDNKMEYNDIWDLDLNGLKVDKYFGKPFMSHGQLEYSFEPARNAINTLLRRADILEKNINPFTKYNFDDINIKGYNNIAYKDFVKPKKQLGGALPKAQVGAGAYGVNQMQDAQPMQKFGGNLNFQGGGNYNMQRALELGYTPDEAGHYPSVDEETGMWLKSKQHPTAWMESMYGYALNPEVQKQYQQPVVNPEGYFGENQLQYVPRKLGGSLPRAGDPVLNFIQSQSPRFSKSKK